MAKQRWIIKGPLSTGGWHEYGSARAAWDRAYSEQRFWRRILGHGPWVHVTCIYSIGIYPTRGTWSVGYMVP